MKYFVTLFTQKILFINLKILEFFKNASFNNASI